LLLASNHLPVDAGNLVASEKDWSPFNNRVEFELAELLYQHSQMSAHEIDTLMDLWATSALKCGDIPPFANHQDLYNALDSIPYGDIPWQSFAMRFGERPDGSCPPWMDQTYDVWFRDPHLIIRHMLQNPEFKGDIDYAPYREYNSSGDRQYQNFMSGEWAWTQGDLIASDPTTHLSTLVPIILGSDKTTVSVATGHNEYYPLYVSLGNVHNSVRRAHCNAVALAAFLAIPKSESFPL
jgi:hypothetical protein